METVAIELLLAYYADDFTGATDALEALATGGIKTMLFVEPPSEELLGRHPDVRAIGIAGRSRAMSPREMDACLPQTFRALQRLRPKFIHYKVCSTFDSSPEIGSIGRAIEIGQSIFENRFVPLVVGAPSLQRFCVFGNLFARSGLESAVFRLDQHPTMRCHPVTPMTEADLRTHLSRQTTLSIELIDVLAVGNGYHAALDQMPGDINAGGRVVLFDTLTDEHLTTVGKLIGSIQERERKPLFVAGSSGVEYALTSMWRSIEQSKNMEFSKTKEFTAEPVGQTVVISGSCSPVTGRQISWGLEHGFDDIRLDPSAICASNDSRADAAAVVKQIVSALHSGRSVIVHSCCGSNDPRFSATEKAECLGNMLGRILRDVIHSHAVSRVVVFGGDTSGHVARSLCIESLEYVAPLEPGAPLCKVRSRDRAVDGLEIVFKGGQVGYDDFLGTVLQGRSDRCVSGGVK